MSPPYLHLPVRTANNPPPPRLHEQRPPHPPLKTQRHPGQQDKQSHADDARLARSLARLAALAAEMMRWRCK